MITDVCQAAAIAGVDDRQNANNNWRNNDQLADSASEQVSRTNAGLA